MSEIVFYIRPDISICEDLICIQAINNETNKSVLQEISNASLNEGIKSLREILNFMKDRLSEK